MAFLFITLFIRSLLSRKKNVTDKLFESALLHENNGQYEEALTHYNNALTEMKKAKHQTTLKASLIDQNTTYSNKISKTFFYYPPF